MTDDPVQRRIDEHVDRIVAAAPPLTASQIERIRQIFGPFTASPQATPERPPD